MNVHQRTDELHAVDQAVFDSMVSAYASPIFQRLLARYGDKTVALQALKETLIGVFHTMQAVNCANPLEAIIYDQARNRQDELINQSMEKSINDAINHMMCQDVAHDLEESSVPESTVPVKVDYSEKEIVAEDCRAPDGDADLETDKGNEPAPVPAATTDSEPPKGKKSRHIGFASFLLVVLLSIGIIAMLWVIVGLLMSTGVLPEVDWGYQWFNMNIAPWFS